MKNVKIGRRSFKFIFFAFYLLLFTCLSYAQTLAPGAPGKDAQWATAGKQAIGTSNTLESKVAFTLAQGVMTEVYYPDLTVANVHLLQFVVVNPKTKKVETERDDAFHEIKIDSINQSKNVSPIDNLNIYKNYQSSSSLAFTQISKSKTKSTGGNSLNGLILGGDNSEWTITKSYVTNPANNSVIFLVQFETKDPNNELYVYYDPSLANTGMGDTAWTNGNTLLAKEKNIFSALSCRYCKFTEITNGFFGVNDGLTQLKNNGKIENFYNRAENGNVVQVAKILPVFSGGKSKEFRFEIALGFGADENTAEKASTESLLTGFNKAKELYQKGWADYVKTLPKVEPKYQAQFNMAAMVLRAQEDKSVRGANVASLTVPWGGGVNANEDVGGGYHLIWSRDLYQVFTAYLALGDTAAANRALDFLFNIQQKPDGSFPQNSWLDGRNGWGGLQMDEVGYPLIMAYQIGRFDKKTYENHVKKAADFIVKNGPKTPQERWEEKGGYSPSTIAAEIAGLVCAAEIAKRNGDTESEKLYLKTADDWTANLEKWTVTTNGKYGDGNYYVRLTANGKPDAGEKIELNNNSGTFPENEIVDAGFLELVRLGIKPPDDPLIVKSLKVVDEVLRVKTPNGESFYRYNNDGYGEMDDGRRWNWDGKYTGKGRLWALLAGERGQYEIAQCDAEKDRDPRVSKRANDCFVKPKTRLDAMLAFANEGLMIPEQIWDKAEIPPNLDRQFMPELKFGEGTGSATPLAWSMAQFIRLAVNLQAGKNLDTPDVVYNRYVAKSRQSSVVSRQSENDSLERFLIKKGNGSFSPPTSYRNPQSPSVFIRKGETETEMMFSYIGNEKSVQIAGDFTGWKPSDLMKFQNFDGYSVKFLKFPNSARVEYKLIVDGKWIVDPLNPNKVDNGVGGENSFFTMLDYKPTTWVDSSGMTKSAISIERVNSKIYGEREVQVYVPEGYEKQPLPVMYVQDGSDYQKRADAVAIQRNLVKANKIKPFIMVFIDYKDRMKEYLASDDYAKYVATEIVPMIDAKYKTVKSRDGRAILGASLGGITSFHAALKYPEIFGRVGGQSSSFWVDNERVVKELEALDATKAKFKFYLDDGTLEGVEDSRKVFEILKKKGFDVTYKEAEAGHNWTAWRDRLADAFTILMN